MAAGLASLTQIQRDGLYEQLSSTTKTIAEGIKAIALSKGIPMTINYAGSMFGLFFTDVEQVTNYQQAINCDTQMFNHFYHAMLDEGVYMAPASYEAGFVSAAHDQEIVDETLRIAEKVLQKLSLA